MAYCKHCGAPLPTEEGARFCISCGAEFKPSDEAALQGNMDNEGDGFLWGLLGCCIPIAGLVLYLAWEGSRPRDRRAMLIGTAIGGVIWAIGYVLLLIVSFFIGMNS